MSNRSSKTTYFPKTIVDWTSGRKPKKGERTYILMVYGDNERYKVIGNISEPPQTPAEIARIKRINRRTLSLMLECLVRGELNHPGTIH